MNELQLTLILAWYYFDKSNNVESFARRFNQYFEKDYSAQTILFSSAKFKNVDPANNLRQATPDERYKTLWDKYIVGDKIRELKELYREFKKGAFYERRGVSDEAETRVLKAAQPYDDVPVDKFELGEKPVSAYPRNAQVVSNALHNADYKCELNCKTELFLRKHSQINYTEGHHLIPLCYQNEFEYSLDVEANVVSLCPNCHRHLHYGDNIADMLKELYEARKERLKKCGIEINFAQLLLMYR
jgi:5-methylcytosine-specific restriction protein A